MKHICYLSIVLFIGNMLLITSNADALTQVKSFLSPRPQTTNAARELVGWQSYINLPVYEPLCGNYGSLTITPEYTQTFRAQEITELFFSTDQLTFSGSRVTDRGEDDILADYFGLPTDFESCVIFFPQARSGILDLNYYVGLDSWHHGFYFRSHTSLVYMRTDMGLCERVIEPGSLNYPAGYASSTLITPATMNATVAEAFKGVQSVGDIEPLRYGKIGCPQARTTLADIHYVLGYNTIREETHHFGINLRLIVPTGNKPTSFYLFEPMIGNGGHWEFGFGLTGHSLLWENKSTDKSWSIYGDLNLTHLFNTWQRRSFDLKNNGPLSRYILIEEIGTPVVAGLTVGGEAAEQQYHGVTLPAVNATTLDAQINIGLQADLVLKLSYQQNAYTFDIGYNLWARTAEKIGCRMPLLSDRFALKGDAQLYGFDSGALFVALNTTQHDATILAGQGDGNANHNFTNDNADNKAIANFRSTPLNQSFAGGIIDTGITALAPVNGSKQAILLTDDDIDNASALSHALATHKFFFHLNHAWDNHRYIPFVGVGGEVEMDMSTRRNRGALSQWGIWLKSGIAF